MTKNFILLLVAVVFACQIKAQNRDDLNWEGFTGMLVEIPIIKDQIAKSGTVSGGGYFFGAKGHVNLSGYEEYASVGFRYELSNSKFDFEYYDTTYTNSYKSNRFVLDLGYTHRIEGDGDFAIFLATAFQPIWSVRLFVNRNPNSSAEYIEIPHRWKLAGLAALIGMGAEIDINDFSIVIGLDASFDLSETWIYYDEIDYMYQSRLGLRVGVLF